MTFASKSKEAHTKAMKSILCRRTIPAGLKPSLFGGCGGAGASVAAFATMPTAKPASPEFSTGPCKQRPGWSTDVYKTGKDST